MVEISLLGRVAVVVDGHTLTGEAAQRRRVALLALLALPPLRPVSRDRLMLHLWADSDTESARHLLSVALHVLRKALGHEAIVTTPDEVALNPALCRSDVGAFEEALGRDDVEAAVALYAGPFMDGFHLGSGPEFEEWLERERSRLQADYARALESAAQRRRAAGDFEGAVRAWQAIALLDPYASRGALGLMRALADAGNRAAAIRHAAIHRELLAGELQVGPDPAVEALAAELRTAKAPAPATRLEAGASAPAGEAVLSPAEGAHERHAGGMEAPAGAPAEPWGAAAGVPPGAAPAEVPAASMPAAGGATAQETTGAVALAASAAAPAAAPATAPSVPPARKRGLVRRGRWWRSPRTGRTVLLAAIVGLTGFVAGRWRSYNRALRSEAITTLAVLPCSNTTPGGDADNLSEGIPGEILTELARVKVKNLRVVPRTSSFAVRSPADARAVGKRLGVQWILSCALETSGNRVRIAVELASAKDGFRRWSRRYESPLGDLFALEESVAHAVMGELFGREAVTGAGSSRAPAPAAHRLYLKGRQAWYQRSPRALAEAAMYFRGAVAADSDYAPAWAALAETEVVAASYEYGAQAPDLAYPHARSAALRALALDPGLAEAHAALASVYKDYDHDWRRAEQEFLTATELNPTYSTARQWYALLLVADGRKEEALRQIQSAGEMDPLSAAAFVARAHYFYYTREYERAAEEVQHALDLDPDFGRAHLLLALIQIQMGRAGEARLRLEALRARAPEPVVVAMLGYAYGREGQRAKALECRRWLIRAARERYVPAELLAMVDVGIDDRSSAFSELETVRRRHSNGLVYLAVEPIMDPLRTDPRFAALLVASRIPRAAELVEKVITNLRSDTTP